MKGLRITPALKRSQEYNTVTCNFRFLCYISYISEEALAIEPNSLTKTLNENKETQISMSPNNLSLSNIFVHSSVFVAVHVIVL